MNDIVRSKITNKTIYNINKTNFESLVYLGCLKLGLQIIIREFYKF